MEAAGPCLISDGSFTIYQQRICLVYKPDPVFLILPSNFVSWTGSGSGSFWTLTRKLSLFLSLGPVCLHAQPWPDSLRPFVSQPSLHVSSLPGLVRFYLSCGDNQLGRVQCDVVGTGAARGSSLKVFVVKQNNSASSLESLTKANTPC